MTEPTICKDPALYDYLLEVSLREHPVLEKLRRETASLEQAAMQTSPEQGQFLYLLARLLGVRRAIEVGTFTG
ncbi:MAG: SAM-dependent methyltransferase, partial [Bacteroidetes bacterium]